MKVTIFQIAGQRFTDIVEPRVFLGEFEMAIPPHVNDCVKIARKKYIVEESLWLLTQPGLPNEMELLVFLVDA